MMSTQQYLRELNESAVDVTSRVYEANLRFLVISFSAEMEDFLKKKINSKLAEKLRSDPSYNLHSTCKFCNKSRNPKLKEINEICDTFFGRKILSLDEQEISLYGVAISLRDDLAHNPYASLGNIGKSEIEKLIAIGEKILDEITAF